LVSSCSPCMYSCLLGHGGWRGEDCRYRALDWWNTSPVWFIFMGEVKDEWDYMIWCSMGRPSCNLWQTTSTTENLCCCYAWSSRTLYVVAFRASQHIQPLGRCAKQALQRLRDDVHRQVV
jgi:hypothetical protein